VKIIESEKRCVILRRGAISARDIEELLKKTTVGWRVDTETVHDATSKHKEMEEAKEKEAAAAATAVVSKKRKAQAVTSSSAHSASAPGQLLMHYAPDGMLCVLVRTAAQDAIAISGGGASIKASVKRTTAQLLKNNGESAGGRVVVIDFKGTLKKEGLMEGVANVAAYRDLSASGDYREAARNLFEYLRWSEDFNDAAAANGDGDGDSSPAKMGTVLIAEIGDESVNEDEFVGGVRDRIFRASSGNVVLLHNK
jgi:hypothetical protein